MRFFTKRSLETLRDRIDLVDLISGYIDLKRAGSTYKGLCPFHLEKTPSFIVRRGDSHYHCFGCGAHGDAIEFLMSYQKLSFTDAVENLAEKFNVKLEERIGGDDKREDRRGIKDALEKASSFFHSLLLHTKDGHVALEYLYKRGITLDFIKTFEIGFSPIEGGLFQKYMKRKGIDIDLLDGAGLVKRKDGRVFDFFSNRLMIPVRDFSGSVIGFSARKIDKRAFGPKYVNSPETALFKKSQILFGLSYSRRRIAKEKRAIIVEGQFDALTMIYEGINITVAGQGTAFGERHVEELTRLGVSKVYLALDGDGAGLEASLKIGDLFQREACEVYVADFLNGTDPDSYIKGTGVKKFLDKLSASPDYLNFLVDTLSKKYNKNSPAAKSRLVQALVDRVKNWGNVTMVNESMKKLSALMDTPQFAMEQMVAPEIERVGRAGSWEIDADLILEMDLLRWLLLVGDSGERFLNIANINLVDGDFKVDTCKKLFERYREAFLRDRKVDLFSLGMELDDPKEQIFLSNLLEKKVNRKRAEEGFLETVQKMLDRRWMEKREEIKKKILKKGLSKEEELLLIKQFDDMKNNRPRVLLSKDGPLDSQE